MCQSRSLPLSLHTPLFIESRVASQPTHIDLRTAPSTFSSSESRQRARACYVDIVVRRPIYKRIHVGTPTPQGREPHPDLMDPLQSSHPFFSLPRVSCLAGLRSRFTKRLATIYQVHFILLRLSTYASASLEFLKAVLPPRPLA